MYKAAGRAFLVNGGAANNITHNLIVNSGIAIYNQHADDMVRSLPLYDNGTVPSIIERRPALFFLGHISPIFAPFFLVFSRFSPS